MQLAAADSDSPLLAAFGTVTSGERGDAKTRVRGIDLAAGAGAWAIGFQAWEGTREKSAATTKPWWAASSFGFTGREHELDSGLVYARARYLSPAAGRFVAPDRLSVSSARNGGLAADPGLRQLLRAAGGFVTDVPEYSYAANGPTVLADPSGLAVMYVGVGATATTFAGGATGGFGMGLGGSPFGLAFLATFGLAFQAGLINISASTDVGIYFALDHDSVCDLKGPFLVEGGDFGVMGISLAWGVYTKELEEALARGTLALPAVSKLPVGIVFSFPILPKGYLPSGGMTLYATWSWILAGGGCGC